MTLFGYTIEFNPWTAGKRAETDPRRSSAASRTLLAIRPGGQAVIKGFAPSLSPARWAHLQSYGLVPGRTVRVVQHSPVTVIQVEHCELALEDDLANLIETEPA